MAKTHEQIKEEINNTIIPNGANEIKAVDVNTILNDIQNFSNENVSVSQNILMIGNTPSGIVLDTVANTSELNSKLESGLIYYGGTLVNVRKISDTTSFQWRITTFSQQGATPYLQYRSTTDGGTTWSEWIDSPFGYISDNTELNSKTETAFYTGVGGQIIIVRKITNSTIFQMRLGTYSNEKGLPVLLYRQTTDGGTTWSDWQNSLFGYFSNNSDLDSKTETAFYTGVGGQIAIVRRVNASKIFQMRLGTLADSDGAPYFWYRKSLDNGSSWSDWFNMVGFDGFFSTNEELSTLIREGVYKFLDGIVCVRRYSQTLVSQWKAGFIDGHLRLQFRHSSNTGTTWTRWITSSGSISNYGLNSMIAPGVYNAYNDEFTSPSLVIVRRVPIDSSNIQQMRIVYDGTSSFIAQQRTSNDDGSSWSAWQEIFLNQATSIPSVPIKSGGKTILNQPNYHVISDAVNYKAASDCQIAIDKTRGICYAVYMTGNTSYYETPGIVRMSKFSLMQPFDVEYFDVMKNGDTDFNNNPVASCYVPNIILINGKVRCFCNQQNGNGIYYRDFDIATETWDFAPKKVQYNNADLTFSVASTIVTAAGQNEPSSDEGIKMTCNLMSDFSGDKYTLINFGGYGNAIIMKSSDGFATMELVGVAPFSPLYESAIAELDGTFYMLYRQSTGIYLVTTSDFENYSDAIQFGNVNQRGDVFSDGNNIYVIASIADNLHPVFKRTNLHLFKGDGAVLSGYDDVLQITDVKGVVYPRVALLGGNYVCIYDSSPYWLETVNGEYAENTTYHGKNCIEFVNVRT